MTETSTDEVTKCMDGVLGQEHDIPSYNLKKFMSLEMYSGRDEKLQTSNENEKLFDNAL